MTKTERPITHEECDRFKLLARCRISQETEDGQFVAKMLRRNDEARRLDTELCITQKQADNINKLCRKYRREISTLPVLKGVTK